MADKLTDKQRIILYGHEIRGCKDHKQFYERLKQLGIAKPNLQEANDVLKALQWRQNAKQFNGQRRAKKL